MPIHQIIVAPPILWFDGILSYLLSVWFSTCHTLGSTATLSAANRATKKQIIHTHTHTHKIAGGNMYTHIAPCSRRAWEHLDTLKAREEGCAWCVCVCVCVSTDRGKGLFSETYPLRAHCRWARFDWRPGWCQAGAPHWHYSHSAGKLEINFPKSKRWPFWWLEHEIFISHVMQHLWHLCTIGSRCYDIGGLSQCTQQIAFWVM